jgi:hypothetical protein
MCTRGDVDYAVDGMEVGGESAVVVVWGEY